MKKQIKLVEKLMKNSDMLAGRPYGVKAREYFEIEKKDKNNEEYIVVIDEEKIESIAPSFFLGLFSISINRFGEQGFFKKYEFKNQNNEKIRSDYEDDIMEAIEWALREGEPMEQ